MPSLWSLLSDYPRFLPVAFVVDFSLCLAIHQTRLSSPHSITHFVARQASGMSWERGSDTPTTCQRPFV